MAADGRPADSAGTPWEGRHFDENAFSGDDGSAPERLIDAIRRFHAREASEVEVVEAFRVSRLLIPLVAHRAEAGTGAHGFTVDKSAELAIVTVAGPDGRNVLPVFSSVEAMQRWNPAARPVPADAVRVALAAASEDTELVVLDPASETEFVIRRPALWAVAQSRAWLPSYLDDDVLAEFLASAEAEAPVASILLDAGDPDARFGRSRTRRAPRDRARARSGGTGCPARAPAAALVREPDHRRPGRLASPAALDGRLTAPSVS
jgi:hypothetical protein